MRENYKVKPEKQHMYDPPRPSIFELRSQLTIKADGPAFARKGTIPIVPEVVPESSPPKEEEDEDESDSKSEEEKTPKKNPEASKIKLNLLPVPKICVNLASEDLPISIERNMDFDLLKAMEAVGDEPSVITSPRHDLLGLIKTCKNDMKDSLDVSPINGISRARRASVFEQQAEIANKVMLEPKKPLVMRRPSQGPHKLSCDISGLVSPKQRQGCSPTNNCNRSVQQSPPRLSKLKTYKNLMSGMLDKSYIQQQVSKLEVPKRKRALLPSPTPPQEKPEPAKMVWKALRHLRINEVLFRYDPVCT